MCSRACFPEIPTLCNLALQVTAMPPGRSTRPCRGLLATVWMVLLTGVTVGTGCSKPPETPAPEPTAFATQQVTLQLNWYPEAEHGGFYTALNSGYYSEAGLEVDIIAGGADVPVLQRVATGQATFGIENADRILLMRAEEADVVAVMAPLQNSPPAVWSLRAMGARPIFRSCKGSPLP